MKQSEQQQLVNWVRLKQEEQQRNEVAFQGEERGFPLYFQLEGVSMPFYLYSTSKDGDHSIYYSVDEEIIELELTPYDFSDEKRMLIQLMEKKAKSFEKNGIM